MGNNSKIKGPLFIGRSWQEYMKMFNLTTSILKKGKILDCASGASSFAAKMNQQGYYVTAMDVLYGKKPDYLEDKCINHLNILVEALNDMEDHFLWGYFKDLDDLKRQRTLVCHEFAEDYKQNQKKSYIKGDLTNMPFKDDFFYLILCSHLLFIYDHRLSYEFHKKSILEMLRVAREIRIYPFVKGASMKSEYVSRIMDELGDTADFELVNVDYEFRKGGNEMMKLIKKN
jgi:hypothetical protein